MWLLCHPNISKYSRALTSVKVKIHCKKKKKIKSFQNCVSKCFSRYNLIQSVTVLVLSFKTNIFTALKIIFSPACRTLKPIPAIRLSCSVSRP